MTTKLGTILADFTTNLATAITIGGTTATLQSATDDDAVALPAGIYFFTLDGENSNKEHIVCTLSGTSLTAISSVSRQGVQTSGAVRSHRIGCTVSLTDFAHIKYINDLLKGTTNLDSTTPLSYDGLASITTANQLATKAYVDAAATGNATYDQNIIAGVAGENLTSGNVVYLKASDGKWYVADSATASKSVGVQLGIAQATVLAAAAVAVLIGGVDRKQTGLTAGSSYYLGVAGAVSTTKGANIRFVGQVPNGSTTSFVVNFASGDPDIALVDGSRTYVADTGVADAYVLTMVPAITAYKTGQIFSFKAANTNTTTSTLNINGLGVKTIKKGIGSTNLSAGDITTGQIVVVIYDGTNFQMISLNGNAVSLVGGAYPAGSGSLITGVLPYAEAQIFTGNGTWTKPTGATRVEVLIIGAGAGGGAGSRGTTAGGGGGGGGGAIVYKAYDASSLSATEAVVIGAAGTAGALQAGTGAGGDGGDGGASTFSSGGNLVTANGGTHGVGGTGGGGGGAGGAGGTVSGGDTVDSYLLAGGAGAAGGTGAANGTAATSLTTLPASPRGGSGGGGASASNQIGGAAATNTFASYHATYGFPNKHNGANNIHNIMLGLVGGSGGVGVGTGGGGAGVAGSTPVAPAYGCGGGG